MSELRRQRVRGGEGVLVIALNHTQSIVKWGVSIVNNCCVHYPGSDGAGQGTHFQGGASLITRRFSPPLIAANYLTKRLTQ